MKSNITSFPLDILDRVNRSPPKKYGRLKSTEFSPTAISSKVIGTPSTSPIPPRKKDVKVSTVRALKTFIP